MMGFGVFGLLSWIGLGSGLLLTLVSLAAGLYYLAELIEVCFSLNVPVKSFLLFCAHHHSPGRLGVHDGLPLSRTLFSLFSLGWYSLMLQTFPTIELLSPIFIGSCVLAIMNHFSWFFYFANHAYSITEVASFFGILVWLIPFTYFISLSANEYTLPNYDPTMKKRPSQEGLVGLDGQSSLKETPKKKGNYIKNLVKNLADEVKPFFVSSTTQQRKMF